MLKGHDAVQLNNYLLRHLQMNGLKFMDIDEADLMLWAAVIVGLPLGTSLSVIM